MQLEIQRMSYKKVRKFCQKCLIFKNGMSTKQYLKLTFLKKKIYLKLTFSFKKENTIKY